MIARPNGTSVRRSQEIVRFDPCGRGWSVRASVDENSPPPHVVSNWTEAPSPLSPLGTLPPSPTRSVSPPNLPPRRGPKPSAVLCPVHNVNELVLKREVAMLETKLAAAERAYKIQETLIVGFCRLHVDAKGR